MKVNGFLKDVLGANRVTKARRDLIASGSEKNIYSDPIRRLTLELHPETTHVKVVKVADVSPTARKFTFEADKGDVLPPFQAGQYVSLDLKIGDTIFFLSSTASFFLVSIISYILSFKSSTS